MKRAIRLDRRTMLRLGGVALGLPLLESMLDHLPARAADQLFTKRFLIAMGAHSTGSDDPMGRPATLLDGLTVPVGAGMTYTLPFGMTPLEALKADITVLSKMDMKAGQPGGVGGAPGHERNIFAQLSGVAPPNAQTFAQTEARAPTADQLMIPTLAGMTTQKSIHLRVSVGAGDDGMGPNQEMSHRRAADNSIQALISNVSPQAVFTALFGNVIVGGTEADRARARLDLDTRVHVVDTVKQRAEALKERLGMADRVRIDRHLAEVRDLERRLSAEPPSFTGQCSLPADPGVDPAQVNTMGEGQYWNENARVSLMNALLRMALVCDLTRIATMQYTVMQSRQSMRHTTGDALCRGSLHGDINHEGIRTPGAEPHQRIAIAMKWHIQQFANLVQSLKDTPEPDGSSMLDNMAAIYVGEGGYDASTNGSHGVDNMIAVVAGRGGGLVPGRHIQATGVHPARVVLTAMRGLGYAGNLGDISNDYPALRSG